MTMLRVRLLEIFTTLLLSHISSVDVTNSNNDADCNVYAENDTGKNANEILDAFWKWRLVNYPEFATFIGNHEYDNRLDEMSLSAYLRREDQGKLFLKQVKDIRRCSKHSSVSSDLELLESQLNIFVSGQKYQSYLWPMNHLEGPQLDLPRLLTWMKRDSTKDIGKIIQRMRLFANQIEESILLMKEGIRVGVTMHKISIKPLVAVLKKMAKEPVMTSTLFNPFHERPTTIDKDDWRPLLNDAKEIITKLIQPAYLRLAMFIENEYLHHTRPHIALTSLTNGDEFYSAVLKYHTSTNLNATEIHKIGLSEVARITKRMMQVKNQVKFQGSLNEFRNYLRTNPKFNYSSGEEIISSYKREGKVIHALIPKYFSITPKTPYRIIPIPASVAPSFPGAYYLAPSKDGSRPGTFYVNTYKPESRKRYEAVSLSLHEAEPGHHLQNALAIEQGPSLPFRRFMDDRKYYQPPASFPIYTAYVEGWGLYSEYLGEEMGLYTSPYDLFGRLSHEMLRACRLVVDTGMHAFRWSREEAINHIKGNTAMDIHDIESEVDRYITWPGQACGYKIGELRIREVRQKAEQALGAKFDLPKFHSFVASMGGVSLDFMERQVDKLIKEYSQ